MLRYWLVVLVQSDLLREHLHMMRFLIANQIDLVAVILPIPRRLVHLVVDMDLIHIVMQVVLVLLFNNLRQALEATMST